VQRIVIVGTSGSGKTTLAQQIAQCLDIPHVELDALHWEPNWQEASDQVFRDRTSTALSGSAWVVDGNYSKIMDLTWGRADTVIWLDYSLAITLWRITKRSLWRSIVQTELWNGNRESLKRLFGQESMILWVLKTYPRRRRDYPILFKKPEHAHLKVIRLSTPQETQKWIRNIT
jgi:adenylate kinase family enzyme